MKITAHFDDSEFRCKCGCGKVVLQKSLVERLEALHKKMNAKSIVINSGYRCPKHSIAVGGYSNDAHTLGFAADVTVYKQDGTPYNVETVAYYADQLGFGGIGMMGGNSIHLDTRDVEKYANNYWHGDERTGNNNVDCKTLKHEEIMNTKPVTYVINVDGRQVWASSNMPDSITIKGV